MVVRAVWAFWDWLTWVAWPLNLAALAQAYRDVLGAEPITFYQWPEPPPGTEPEPAAPAADAGPAPAMPGDGALSSPGQLHAKADVAPSRVSSDEIRPAGSKICINPGYAWTGRGPCINWLPGRYDDRQYPGG
jgi:hypothetical protein